MLIQQLVFDSPGADNEMPHYSQLYKSVMCVCAFRYLLGDAIFLNIAKINRTTIEHTEKLQTKPSL